MKRSLTTLLVSSLVVTSLPPHAVIAESKTDERKQELKEIRKQQDEAKQAVKELEKKIKPLKEKVTKLEKQIEHTSRNISALEKEMKRNKKELDRAKEIFKNRVRTMYQQGDMGSMRALLEADSIQEFLARFELLRIILKQDQQEFETYRKLYEKQLELKKKWTEMKKEQKEEADKVKDAYDEMYAEIRKTEDRLRSLNLKESEIKAELESLVLVSASLYPLKYASTSGIDPWGFYNRQCTSFVAWRLNQRGTRFTNTMKGGRWSNATNWDDNARRLGYTVSQTPRVGAVAQWNAGVGGASSAGHVAYVTDVNGSRVTVEEYNWSVPYGYSKRQVSASEVSNFIYITD